MGCVAVEGEGLGLACFSSGVWGVIRGAVTRRSKDFVLGANVNGVPTADDARSQGSKTSKRSGKSG